MTTAPAYDNSVRIGYARVSTRAQEHQVQLDSLAEASISSTPADRRHRLEVDMREWLPEDDLVFIVLDALAMLAVARSAAGTGPTGTGGRRLTRR
jgi:hypothetical protein